MTHPMRRLMTLLEAPQAPLQEGIIHRDRTGGLIIAVNPTAVEFKTNFKISATGVLMKNGDFFVASAADQTLAHIEAMRMVGYDSGDARYHLGVWPSKVVVELWDNLDEVSDLPEKVTRAVYDKYGRFPKAFRDEAGQAVRGNPHIQRAYGKVFNVFVDVYAPELSNRRNGLLLRDRY